MPKHRIALAVALLFSLPAAVVAIDMSAATSETEAAETAQEALAAASEPATGAAPAEGSENAAATTERADATAHNATIVPVEHAAAVPNRAVPESGPRPQRTTYKPHPLENEVGVTFLPRQLEYLARIEAERAHLVARGDAFPAESPINPMLPSQLAYFERVEQARITAARSRELARAEAAASAAPAAPTASPGELLVAHRALAQ